MQVPRVSLLPYHFLDKNTLLYGESQTGKSTIILDAMYLLCPLIEQVVVFCPTDAQNKTYARGDDGVVNLLFVHSTISAAVLSDLWERQEAFYKKYREIAGEIDGLFRMVASPTQADDIANLDGIRETAADACQRKKAEELLLQAKRKAIATHASQLLAGDRLTPAQRRCVEHINFNPRMLIIFDDCTEQLNSLKNNETIQKIFFQGRHFGITLLASVHTAAAIAPSLRQNAHISVFTTTTALNGFADKDNSAGVSAEEKKWIKQAGANIFRDHTKLMFTKIGNARWATFEPAPHKTFRFGSELIWEYANKCVAETQDLSGNKFMRLMD